MRADKVREMDAAELKNQLKEGEEQLFRLKFQMAMGQTDGLKKYRELKKDRARILTILRERETVGSKADSEKSGSEPAAQPARKGKK